MSAEVSESAPAPEVSQKKVPAKKTAAASKPKKVKQPAPHPSYGDMVKAALVALKEKKGSSRAAILKYILQNYKVGENLTAVSFMFFFFCFIYLVIYCPVVYSSH